MSILVSPDSEFRLEFRRTSILLLTRVSNMRLCRGDERHHRIQP